MVNGPQADGLLRCILGNSSGAEDKATDVTRLPRWRKAEPLAKSYLGNTLHILGASAAGLWVAVFFPKMLQLGESLPQSAGRPGSH